MNKSIINPSWQRFLFLSAFILCIALTRLLPHPPNFTPIGAIALFGGAYFNKKAAFTIPLLSLFISDAIIGFHGLMIYVYGSFILSACIGFMLKNRKKLLPVASAAFTSSLLFFLVTNFGVWFSTAFYEKSLNGLLTCYIAGIPFFGNTLVGDLFYSFLLFGGFHLFEKKFTVLQEKQSVIEA